MTAILSVSGVLHRRLCGMRTVFAVVTIDPREEIIGWLYGPKTIRKCQRCYRDSK